jgi:apolipoprotein D and lipocalin family protein
VAPDYSWALIDYPGRDLAWIFAREPVMDKTQYRELEGRMRGHGVNTDKLRRVPQVRDQVGRLGFADPKNP